MQTYLHATATLKPMRPSEALQNHITAIRSAIHQHHTTNPRVFGSVLAGTDRDGSDLDLLVDPLPETTLFDLGGLQIELEALLGVPVDVQTPGDLPVQIRARILAEARPL